jgi:hypothetical protein
MTNTEQDKAAMRQAADKIAELRQELVDCKESAEVAKRELVAAYQECDEMVKHEKDITASIEFAFKIASEKLKSSLQFAQPDSVAEKAAITMLQGMTPGQVTTWLGKMYASYVNDQERALEAIREG